MTTGDSSELRQLLSVVCYAYSIALTLLGVMLFSILYTFKYLSAFISRPINDMNMLVDE